MRGGSDQLSLSCFRLRDANASPFGGHLRRPVHRQIIEMIRWHLHCDHAGQPFGCWVFVRVPVDSTSWTSRSSLANTVVFFPLALRQRTHRNAIGLSRYCTEDSRLTERCQDGTIPVWRKNRKHVPCASTNKIARLLQRFAGTLVSPQTMRPSGWRCSERCEKLNSVPLHPSPN